MAAIVGIRRNGLIPHDGNHAPRGPFVLNKESEKAQGLIFAGTPRGPLSMRDFSEKGNHLLTVNGTPTLVSSSFGFRVHNFTQASSERLVLDRPLVLRRPLTMAGWFNSNTDTNGGQTIMSAGRDDATQDLVRMTLQDNQGGSPLRIRVMDDGSASQNSVDVSTDDEFGVWHLGVAVLHSDGSIDGYFDGTGKKSDSTNTPDPLFENFAIGVRVEDTPIQHFGGSIGPCFAWNKALNEQEVFNLWHPSTRWDLYHELGQKVFSFGTSVPRRIVGPRASTKIRDKLIKPEKWF